MYEAALSYGLDPAHESTAGIQLASSLRNVGRLAYALHMLEDFDFSDEFCSARDAFKALIAWDLGEGPQAVKAALHAAAPALGKYRRAIETYSEELQSNAVRNNDIVDGVAEDDPASSSDDLR